MSEPLASIIVRTCDEERWIDKCLEAIASQDYLRHEVIIVDNDSKDATLRKVERFNVKVLSISEFRPGDALNKGIRASKGDVIVCLSAHCIPSSRKWLSNLVAPLNDLRVAGVYGRQEPLPFSDPYDKRDLLTVFGLDPKTQVRDPFFHNANSALRRSTWERFPFDEDVKNLEDRVWGQVVIDAGMTILYEPAASVYHWHGIHQGLDLKRANGVVRVMEQIHGESPLPKFLATDQQHNVVVIPVRSQPEFLLQQELVAITVRQALSLKDIKKVIVSTDSDELASVARHSGAEVPFIRPSHLTDRAVDVIDVVRHAVTQVEKISSIVDAVVLLEVAYPLRRATDISAMLDRLYAEGLEVVVAGRRERRGLWADDNGVVVQVGEGFKPRELKKSSAYIGLLGYGTIIRGAALRGQDPFRSRVGVFEVSDEITSLEFRSGMNLRLARRLFDQADSARL
jgi:rhamnosyltransferase